MLTMEGNVDSISETQSFYFTDEETVIQRYQIICPTWHTGTKNLRLRTSSFFHYVLVSFDKTDGIDTIVRQGSQAKLAQLSS